MTYELTYYLRDPQDGDDEQLKFDYGARHADAVESRTEDGLGRVIATCRDDEAALLEMAASMRQSPDGETRLRAAGIECQVRELMKNRLGREAWMDQLARGL